MYMSEGHMYGSVHKQMYHMTEVPNHSTLCKLADT